MTAKDDEQNRLQNEEERKADKARSDADEQAHVVTRKENTRKRLAIVKEEEDDEAMGHLTKRKRSRRFLENNEN